MPGDVCVCLLTLMVSIDSFNVQKLDGSRSVSCLVRSYVFCCLISVVIYGEPEKQLKHEISWWLILFSISVRRFTAILFTKRKKKTNNSHSQPSILSPVFNQETCCLFIFLFSFVFPWFLLKYPIIRPVFSTRRPVFHDLKWLSKGSVPRRWQYSFGDFDRRAFATSGTPSSPVPLKSTDSWSWK